MPDTYAPVLTMDQIHAAAEDNMIPINDPRIAGFARAIERAAIEAFQRQQAAPEGWKPMPAYATTEMALRGIEATPSKRTLTPYEWEEYELMSPLQQSLFRACKLWNAMFTVAPPPPGSKG